jgi:carboxymethylenebutenolidase
MRQDIIDLYDAYTHERLDRRIFMDRLAAIAGGTAAAAALLPVLQANYAKAAIVAPDDARVRAERITFQGASGEVQAYLVRPADAPGALPGVVVIHENRGLNPHIEDVARRLALEGFVALAPDFLSPKGGTPADEDQARELIGQLDQQQTIQNALAAVDFLKDNDAATGKVGVVGFCWGGALANQIAVNSAEVDAVVPFYGRQPASSDVAKIQAPLLLHYAGVDERINAGIPAYEQALQGRRRELHHLHVRRGEPRLPQRHVGSALRPRGGPARLVAHDRFLQAAPVQSKLAEARSRAVSLPAGPEGDAGGRGLGPAPGGSAGARSTAPPAGGRGTDWRSPAPRHWCAPAGCRSPNGGQQACRAARWPGTSGTRTGRCPVR